MNQISLGTAKRDEDIVLSDGREINLTKEKKRQSNARPKAL